MLEIKYVRQNLSEVKKALAKRGETADLETFEKTEAARRTLLSEIEDLRHRRNVVSDEIASRKKAGEDAEALVLEMRKVSSEIKHLDKARIKNEAAMQDILISLPNIPHASVPTGKDESSNQLLRQIGQPPVFDFEPLPHWTLGERHHIFDFERAAKITGARFPLYMGTGARMERALINFMLDIHTLEHGFLEILPPFLVNQG
jgi:seryl-tRNA synthetase